MKKIQDAEEDQERTQKEMAETNLLLKKLFSLQGNASSST
jgi:hypothetical protein